MSEVQLRKAPEDEVKSRKLNVEVDPTLEAEIKLLKTLVLLQQTEVYCLKSRYCYLLTHQSGLLESFLFLALR